MTQFEVEADNSGVYTATIVDGSNAVVPGSTLSAATLTLYDSSDPTAIINTRDAQDILNTNDVTIDELGVLVWNYGVADMPTLHATQRSEIHIALFNIVWSGGEINHFVRFRVKPLGS